MRELLLVEQRAGDGDDDAPTGSSKAAASCPGVDDNRRMDELRRGLLRHAGVRAADADADSEDVERTLSVAARARLPGGAGRGRRASRW